MTLELLFTTRQEFDQAWQELGQHGQVTEVFVNNAYCIEFKPFQLVI